MTTSAPWSSLGLPQAFVDLLANHNFTSLMPVQKAAIPLFQRNADLVVEAVTGSGKTLAFVVPLLAKLQPQLAHKTDSEPRFTTHLFLAPTRELCLQTLRVIQMFGELPGLKGCAAAVTGGRPIEQDLKLVEHGFPILVGTVGRLNQILSKQGSSFLRRVDVLVVDEADRVLKQKGLTQVMAGLPKQRRTYLFSATLQQLGSEESRTFGLRNAMRVVVRGKTQSDGHSKYMLPASLQNEYCSVPSREHKILFLINFLWQHRDKKLLVFFNTCASVAFYHRAFQEVVQLRQLMAKAITGQMKQKRRQNVIQEFVQAKKGILFGTDVVARGIDFQGVDHILQVDPPVDPASFVHRIGRTARLNRTGQAVVLLQPNELTFVDYLKTKGVEMREGEMPAPRWTFEWAREGIWGAMAQDQDIILKSKQAFVSFVRAFKEHELKHVFDFAKLDLGHVANSFFLFRVPRVKEILGKPLENFIGADLDPKEVPFKNKNQQKMINERIEQHRRQAEEQLEKAKSEGRQLSQKQMRIYLRRAGRLSELSKSKSKSLAKRDRKHSEGRLARKRMEGKFKAKAEGLQADD